MTTPRIVTQLPLQALWDERGPVDARRGEACGARFIRDCLRAGAPVFVVVDVGAPPRWIGAADVHAFWKGEVQPHLVEPDQTVFLDAFPDGYAYFASVWEGAQSTIIVLEKAH